MLAGLRIAIIDYMAAGDQPVGIVDIGPTQDIASGGDREVVEATDARFAMLPDFILRETATPEPSRKSVSFGRSVDDFVLSGQQFDLVIRRPRRAASSERPLTVLGFARLPNPEGPVHVRASILDHGIDESAVSVNPILVQPGELRVPSLIPLGEDGSYDDTKQRTGQADDRKKDPLHTAIQAQRSKASPSSVCRASSSS
jgi:hypothetical protein